MKQNRSITLQSYAIIGQGRLGKSLAQALKAKDIFVEGPLGRGERPDRQVDAVLLCVPDTQISAVASTLPVGQLVGHCSGANGVGLLEPHEGFVMHPLMTFPVVDSSRFDGAGCAVAGSTPRALEVSRELAALLGMNTFTVADADRPLYHAGASIASNFLIALESAAQHVFEIVGVDRKNLLPLLQATIDNWGALGAKEALTGPIVRNDEATIASQRAAIADRAPEFIELFDVLVSATKKVVAQ